MLRLAAMAQVQVDARFEKNRSMAGGPGPREPTNHQSAGSGMPEYRESEALG